MGAGHVREGDADLLHAVLEDARHDDLGPAFPWALFEGLQRLVPSDLDVSYQVHDHRHRQTVFFQCVDEGNEVALVPPPEPPDDPFWRLWWSSICSWPQRSGDLRRVVFSDDFFPTRRALRADPMHA